MIQLVSAIKDRYYKNWRNMKKQLGALMKRFYQIHMGLVYFIIKVCHQVITVMIEKLQKYDKAIECYNKVIRLDPNFSIAFYNKGEAVKN